MRRILASFASIALLGLATAAHATTLIPAGTYSLTGVTAPGGTITGSLTFNAAGQVSGISNVEFNDAGAGDPLFTSYSNGNNDGHQDVTLTSSTGSGGQMILYFSSVSGSTVNLVLCSSSCSPANTNDSYIHLYNSYNAYNPADLTAGMLLAPSAAAPEPSSLLLLGTGLAGFAGAVRRRFRR